jgi:hypothetical protein
MYAIEVRGNRLHDEGDHDSEMRVIRTGGGHLTFATEAEAEAHADKLFAALPPARRGIPRLQRSDYTIVTA